MTEVVNEKKAKKFSFNLSGLFAGSAILVFTHDQFVLRGALVRKKDKGVEVIADASSLAVSAEQALAEVLEGLQETQKKLPKKAIFATAAIVSGVFELPVDPKKPRPAKQMQELVRWELAEQLSDHNEQWTLGAIAVGRGYITTAQRQDVVQKIAEMRAENTGGRAPRFGDICLSEKYLRNEQHEECLDIQEQLVEPDDDLVCDWKPFTLQAEEGAETHNWYCVGMGRVYRNQWARAFRTEGIKLSGFAPLTGLSLGLVAMPLEDNISTLLLELHRNQLICYQLEKDDLGRTGLSRIRVESRSEGVLDQDMMADLCLEFVDDSLEKVTLCVPFDANPNVIAETLEARLDRPISLLSTQTKQSGVKQALAGVANNLLNSSQGGFLLQIPANDPPPPVWKNPVVLRFLIPAVVFAGLGTNEAYTRFDTNKMQGELNALKSNTKQTGQLNAAASAALSKSNALKKEIIGLESELNSMKKVISRLQKVYDRSSLPTEVFRILGRTVKDDVMLEKFIEPRRSKTPGFHLHAWSLDDAGAQSFVGSLGRNLIDINYEIIRPQVFAERNRYGEKGFGIDLWVVPEQPVVEPVKKGKKK